MKHLVIVNAKSGTVRDRGRRALAAEIEEAFAEHRAGADVRMVHPRRFAGEIARALKRRRPPGAIVVGGGDGSLSTAAGLLAGRKTALGILPLGTMNLLARALGMPLAPDEAVAALLGAKSRKIDLLDINGRTVLLHASIGLQPRIIRVREMLPYRTRFMRLTNGVIAWIRATRRLRPVRVAARSQEGSFERAASAILISNNALPEGIGEMPVAHDMTRGEIGLYVCASLRRSDLVKLTLATSLGIWRESDLVEEFIALRLDIDTNKASLLLSIDGELARLRTPLRCRVKRRSLAVLTPQGRETERGNTREAVTQSC